MTRTATLFYYYLLHISDSYKHLDFYLWGTNSSIESQIKIVFHSTTFTKKSSITFKWTDSYIFHLKWLLKITPSQTEEILAQCLLSPPGLAACGVQESWLTKQELFIWKFEEKKYYLIQNFSVEISLSSDPVLRKLLNGLAETFPRNSAWGRHLVLKFRQVMCLKIEFWSSKCKAI